MLNMNRVTLLGHAGRDPEIRTIKSGEKTATFSLATTESGGARTAGRVRPPSGTGSLCSAPPSRQSKSWSARAPRF